MITLPAHRMQALGDEIAQHEYDHLSFFQNKLTQLNSPYPAQQLVCIVLLRTRSGCSLGF